VLFVADCVQSGFGRAGSGFAISQWGVSPDIITFNKGISSGYFPLGGMIVSDKIIDVLIDHFNGHFRHGQSYTNNPLGAAVGAKVLEILTRDDLINRTRERGVYLLHGLHQLYDRHPIIGEVRGRGLLVGAEFVKDRATKEPFAPEVRLSRRLIQSAQDRGVLISAPSGNAAFEASDGLRLTPPMVVSEQELDIVLETLDDVLTEVEGELL
jgi:adenosylmethionine-8-amino-7-oxononanoate aminotransferase